MKHIISPNISFTLFSTMTGYNISLKCLTLRLSKGTSYRGPYILYSHISLFSSFLSQEVYMFSKQELSLFKSSYFSNFSYFNGIIEIQSKNTGHWWQISKQDMPRSTMIKVLHKYKFSDKYHKQCYVHTFRKAINIIKGHDDYITKIINY